MEETKTNNTRVRLNLKQTSKGEVYFDITAEAPTVEKAGQLLDIAISEVKVRAKENELVLVKGNS
jgi:glutamate 5-kinase